MLEDRNLNSRIICLCDVAEEPAVRGEAHESSDETPGLGAEGAGFFVCDEDLRTNIRASGVDKVKAVIESQGDLRSLERLQLQPAWRHRPLDLQLRRFMGSGSRGKQRYTPLLAGSIDIDRIPAPLRDLLDEL